MDEKLKEKIAHSLADDNGYGDFFNGGSEPVREKYLREADNILALIKQAGYIKGAESFRRLPFVSPNEEWIKELWEGCRFKPHLLKYDPMHKPPNTWGWEVGDGITKKVFHKLPPIDLNNLFKYAVPKLREKYTHLEIMFEYGVHGNTMVVCTVSFQNYISKKMQRIASIEVEDFALALFWAIWEVFKGVDNG